METRPAVKHIIQGVVARTKHAAVIFVVTQTSIRVVALNECSMKARNMGTATTSITLIRIISVVSQARNAVPKK